MNQSPTTWSDVSLNTVAVAVNRVKSISTGNFIAVGIDGAMWKNHSSNSNWYLKNSDTIQRLNSVAVNGSGSGLVCGTNGKLYRVSAANTQQPVFTSVNINMTAHLMDVALEPSGTSAYVTAANGQVLRAANYTSGSLSQASQVSPYPVNGVIYRTATHAVAVGNLALIANYYGTSVIVNEEIHTKNLISIHFYDANTGCVIDSSNVIWRTTDGGVTWSVVLPQTGSPPLTKVYTTKPNEAILIGLNRYASLMTGTSLASIASTSAIASGTHFYDIHL